MQREGRGADGGTDGRLHIRWRDARVNSNDASGFLLLHPLRETDLRVTATASAQLHHWVHDPTVAGTSSEQGGQGREGGEGGRERERDPGAISTDGVGPDCAAAAALTTAASASILIRSIYRDAERQTE